MNNTINTTNTTNTTNNSDIATNTYIITISSIILFLFFFYIHI